MNYFRSRTSITLLLGLLLSAIAAMGQQYKPAIEYFSLMDLRFYENQGGWLVEGLEVVFPPAGLEKATFVISRPNGEVLTSVPLRIESLGNYPAFGMFKPDGVPGTAELGQTGDFVMAVKINGQSITELPFSLKKEVGTDPFNPKTEFLREGPWRDLAFFSSRVDEPDSHIEFNWWMNQREMPAVPKGAYITTHLMRGTQEIAASRVPVVSSSTDWQYFYRDFVTPEKPRSEYMTLAALTKQDGEISIVLKANGQPVKTYKTRVVGGKLEGLPRNKMGVEPQTTFISPRQVDVSARTSSRYQMREMFWMKKS